MVVKRSNMAVSGGEITGKFGNKGISEGFLRFFTAIGKTNFDKA